MVTLAGPRSGSTPIQQSVQTQAVFVFSAL